MSPTIGRIVHFHPNQYAADRINSDAGHEKWGNKVTPGEPIAAVVVRVWSSTCVNLMVLPDGPTPFWFTSVSESVDEPGEGVNSYWTWPPRV